MRHPDARDNYLDAHRRNILYLSLRKHNGPISQFASRPVRLYAPQTPKSEYVLLLRSAR
jgi:hypothetical protein